METFAIQQTVRIALIYLYRLGLVPLPLLVDIQHAPVIVFIYLYRLGLVPLPLLVDIQLVPVMLDLSTQTHPWPFGHNQIRYVFVSIVFELEQMCIQVWQK